MSTKTNKDVVARHRKRLKRKGLVRVEVQVPREDAETLRTISRALRDPGEGTAVRAQLRQLIGNGGGLTFKEALRSGPPADLDIERVRELPRDIDL